MQNWGLLEFEVVGGWGACFSGKIKITSSIYNGHQEMSIPKHNTLKFCLFFYIFYCFQLRVELLIVQTFSITLGFALLARTWVLFLCSSFPPFVLGALFHGAC